MLKKAELLCPVGGMDTLDAALYGGADAVYFGTKEFNARMNAKNFSDEEIRAAVYRCHEKGVRAYITFNTLLTDRNLAPALEQIAFLYEAGCDALILADRGLARLIRESFPDFELHASTQMSGHCLSAAEALREDGFSRMVCARELSRENIAHLCASSPIEIEMFVHGAICASHSGQCLMSSMIGDRSGNRGQCAQPCRLPYNGSYPLSFKDLSLARHVTELLSLDLASLKIEGRMKSPAYVYSTARIWRTLLDEERNATQREMEILAGVFSRSGFTDGYFTGKINPSMLGIRTESDKKTTGKTSVTYKEAKRRIPPISIRRERREGIMPPLPEKQKASFVRSARFARPDQIPQGDFFRIRYLPLELFDGSVANGVILPPVIFDSELDGVRAALLKAAREGAEHLLVGNLGHVALARESGLVLHGDFRLNLTNSFAALSYSDFEDLILSPELNLAQMRDFRGKKSVIVYGRLPLMLLEKRVGQGTLTDRRGARFPILREGGRDILLNSVPFYMADRQKDLKEKGLASQHFIFTTESKKEVEALLLNWQEKKESKYPVKRIK